MKKLNKKIVVTVSGGMDSAVLLWKAIDQVGSKNVYPLFFDYGQRHIREKDCAYAQAEINKLLLKVVDVKSIRELASTSSLTNNAIKTPNVKDMMGEAQPKSYVPFRNMMFLSMCCAYAETVGATEVWYGATKIDSLAGYWDAEEGFVKKLNEVVSLNREKSISIVAPLLNSDKMDIIKEGVRLGARFDKTYTCYSGEMPADAESASSSLRIQGFIRAGFVDPMPYKQNLEKVWKKNNCKLISY
jgi:7-cyano-7-deazaguanine synthase